MISRSDQIIGFEWRHTNYRTYIITIIIRIFSSAETSLTTVSKIKMRALADDGNKRAAAVLEITEKHTGKMLSAFWSETTSWISVPQRSPQRSLTISADIWSVLWPPLWRLRSSFSERSHRRTLRRSKLRIWHLHIFRSSNIYDYYDAVHFHHQSDL